MFGNACTWLVNLATASCHNQMWYASYQLIASWCPYKEITWYKQHYLCASTWLVNLATASCHNQMWYASYQLIASWCPYKEITWYKQHYLCAMLVHACYVLLDALIFNLLQSCMIWILYRKKYLHCHRKNYFKIRINLYLKLFLCKNLLTFKSNIMYMTQCNHFLQW